MSNVIALNSKLNSNENIDFGLENSAAVFPVSERDIQIVGREPGCTLPVSTHKAIIRADKDGSNPRGIGIVGRDYKRLSNRKMFGSLEDTLRKAIAPDLMRGVQVNTETSFDGAWCQREYVFPSFSEALTTSSKFQTNIGFRIIGWNSYDGSSSAGMVSGLIDFYCTNGMVVGSMVDMSKRRHTKNLLENHFDQQVYRGIERVQQEIVMLRKMANTSLDLAAAETLLQKQFSETRAKKILERVHVEADVRGMNVFALHSALTFYASHNSDEFSVRNTGNDNVAKTLHNRQAEIAKIMPAIVRMAA